MQLLTPKEVAARLSVSPRTVYGWIAEGRLDAVHLSERVTRVPEESVDAMVMQAFEAAANLIPLREHAAEEQAVYQPTVKAPVAASSVSQHVLAVLNQHREQINSIVERGNGSNVRVFGSIVRGNATDASDIDLLVDAGSGMSLFDLSEIESRIEAIVGRRVDVVVAASVRSEIRQRVLGEARSL